MKGRMRSTCRCRDEFSPALIDDRSCGTCQEGIQSRDRDRDRLVGTWRRIGWNRAAGFLTIDPAAAATLVVHAYDGMVRARWATKSWSVDDSIDERSCGACDDSDPGPCASDRNWFGVWFFELNLKNHFKESLHIISTSTKINDTL